MRVLRFALLIALLIIAVPAFAQEDVTIDPAGEFTEVYTYENITFNYPTGIVASDENAQITFDFDGNYTDYITVATPLAFDAYSIAHDTFEIASQAVFEVFSGTSVEAITYEEAVIETTLVGLPATYFEVAADGYTIYAYVILIGEDIYAVTLITNEAVMPAADELLVLEGIMATMTIDGELVAVEVEPVATDEPVATGEIAERDIPAAADVLLNQDVSLFEGVLTFKIPETWAMNEDTVGTTEDAFSAMNNEMDNFGEDDLVLQFTTPALISQLPLEEVTPLTVAEFIASQEMFTESSISTYPDLPVAVYVVDVVGDEAPEGAFFYVIQLGDSGDVLLLGGVSADFEAQESLIFAILDTLEYVPVEE